MTLVETIFGGIFCLALLVLGGMMIIDSFNYAPDDDRGIGGSMLGIFFSIPGIIWIISLFA